MVDLTQTFDVLVAGGGNAALCAAITARRAGATVVLAEHAPKSMRGGNSRHTRNVRALHHGATIPTCTVNGLGERAGNAPLHTTVMILKELYGVTIPGFRYDMLWALRRKVEEYSGLPVGASEPVIGHWRMWRLSSNRFSLRYWTPISVLKIDRNGARNARPPEMRA